MTDLPPLDPPKPGSSALSARLRGPAPVLAAIAAVLSAWVLAVLDGRALDPTGERSPWPMLGALIGLWTLWSLVSAPLAWAGVELARRIIAPAGPSTNHLEPVIDRLDRLALRLAEAAWLGLVLHRVGLLLTWRSTETLVIGLALVGAGVLPLLGATRRWATRRIARAAPGRPRRALCVVVALLSVGVVLLSLATAHSDYVTELTRDFPWGVSLLAVPPLVAFVVGVLVTRALRPTPLGLRARQPALLAWSHVVRAPLLLGLLALVGVSAGLLGARAADPEQARALRDTPGLWSSPLVSAAFAVGVPTPPLGAAQGLRGCMVGQGLGAPGSVGRVGADAPDILFITIDGVRLDHTSLLPGSTHPNTPRLLERSRQGASFTRAYTPAPSTRAAFRSIFSGLLPGQVDAPPASRFPWALTLTPAQPTLAAYLREAGYETIALISKPKAFPEESSALTGFAEIDEVPAEYHLRHRHSAQLKISRIIGRLAEPPPHTNAPRFVWTHLIEPHYPYTRGPTEGSLPSPRDNEARHDLAVQYVDEQLERLLRFALAPERRARTIVIVTSDHGEAFDEHRNARHGATVYEEELRVPLVVVGGGVRAGTYDTPVSLVELLPTVLGLAGLEVPVGVCGDGLTRTLRAGTPIAHQPLFAAALPDGTTRYHQLAFLVGDEKLVVDGETGIGARFDLIRDPRERQPDTSSAAAQALRRRFESFLAERGLPAPSTR
ncbi:MAG: sulfatase-like hydrolase/transferase [Polyangiales bacterium]